MKTSKQAITAIKAMANRLDEIDGMYVWEQDARIAELERSYDAYRCRGGLTGVVLG